MPAHLAYALYYNGKLYSPGEVLTEDVRAVLSDFMYTLPDTTDESDAQPEISPSPSIDSIVQLASIIEPVPMVVAEHKARRRKEAT